MTSLALTRPDPDWFWELTAWLDSFLHRPLTAHRELYDIELDMASVWQSLEEEDTDHPSDEYTPVEAVGNHALNLRLFNVNASLERNWARPEIRLSSMYASLDCWHQFFAGIPDWEPVLFECDTTYEHRDVHVFVRTSTVSRANSTWRTAVCTPRWFHQLLTAPSWIGSFGDMDRFLGRPRESEYHPAASVSLPVPSAQVLTDALSLWTPSDHDSIYRSLVAVVAVAQNI